MNDELADLYQEVLLDHGRRPRNRRPLPDATHSCDGLNPLCGDHVHVHLRVVDGRFDEVTFEGQGCAVSTASASLMGEVLTGSPVAEFEGRFDALRALVMGEEVDGELGKLAVFRGVAAFPMRVKCATLAWHAARSALSAAGRASTE